MAKSSTTGGTTAPWFRGVSGEQNPWIEQSVLLSGGVVVPVPPPPARHAGGKTSVHTMHQPGQLDVGREARSSGIDICQVPLIRRPDGISRHSAVNLQYISQQSSAVISHNHLSLLRLAAMFPHVMCMRCARGLATCGQIEGQGLTLGPRCVDSACFTRRPGARAPALKGMPGSVLGAIVGGDRSCNELTSSCLKTAHMVGNVSGRPVESPGLASLRRPRKVCGRLIDPALTVCTSRAVLSWVVLASHRAVDLYTA